MTAVVIGSSDHLAEIRSMAGGPTTTEITPTRLTNYYNDAKDWVELGSGIDIEQTNSGETGYSNIKNAITFRASVLIRYGWRDKENKAQEHSAEARRLLTDIISSSEQATSTASAASHQSTTQYKTANMISSSENPGIPYKSPDFNF